MSNSIGTIHYELFHKIELQNKLVQRIIEKTLSPAKQTNFRIELGQACGKISEGSLEDNIDEENIHGWLQNQISVVERNLAYSITKMLQNQMTSISCLMEISYEFGLDHPVQNGAIDAVFEELEKRVLNGMPCERNRQIQKKTNDVISWTEIRPIHLEYWQLYKGEISHYYEILEQFIKGMTANTDFGFSIVNGLFELKRRG